MWKDRDKATELINQFVVQANKHNSPQQPSPPQTISSGQSINPSFAPPSNGTILQQKSPDPTQDIATVHGMPSKHPTIVPPPSLLKAISTPNTTDRNPSPSNHVSLPTPSVQKVPVKTSLSGGSSASVSSRSNSTSNNIRN